LLNLRLNNCIFPTNYLYDVENFAWANIYGYSRDGVDNLDDVHDKIAVVGITPVLSYIAGKVNKIKLKATGESISKGKSLGTLESLKYFGVIRSPITGTIIEVNEKLFSDPKLINDFPFYDGWIAKMKVNDKKDQFQILKHIEDCKSEILMQIAMFNVKCFKYFPDFEMYELGTECSATLAKLDDFMSSKMTVGQIVHLVSDDPTADLELSRWAIDNGQKLEEITMERNEKISTKDNMQSSIFHVLMRKLH
jgi:glycine cleavage system H protein